MKKENIIKNIMIILNIILFFYLVFIFRNQYIYNMSYTKCILFMIFNSLFIFTYGILKDDDKTFKSNIIIYIFYFLILLISITFLIGRGEFKIYDRLYAGQYKPFYTIISEFKYGSKKNIVYNFIMLIPLSFLLMIKNKKYKNIFLESIIILPTIIIIELLQAFTHSGVFDIDDIILNYFGVIIFNFIITRFSLIDKIRKLFYTDFNLKIKNKNIIFYISLAILIIYDIFIFIK